MTNSIDQAFVQQFSDYVHVLAQQQKSRLRGSKAVVEKMVTGKDFFYDRIADSEAHEVTSRHADTVLQDIAHSRRMGTIRTYTHTFLLDDGDDLSTIINPQAEYAAATARAMNRLFDKVAVDAATASVLTGRKGDTSVSFASDGGLTISSGGLGMTYGKVRDARKNFVNNEVGNEVDEQDYLLITGNQEDDMFGEDEFISGDYNRPMIVENGVIQRALGFNTIKYGASVNNPILGTSSGERVCLALAERAICVGIQKDISIQVSPRADKNNNLQVQAKFYLAAIRTEGVRVQKILCTEA